MSGGSPYWPGQVRSGEGALLPGAGTGRTGKRKPTGRAAVAERRRLYGEARESGADPWGACVAAGWEPDQRGRYERQYQSGWTL